MDNIKKYRKIPMIAIIFSIITMIILTYNAIFGFDGVNPIDNSRLARLLENKKTIETEIKNYSANVQSKDFSITSLEEVVILNDKYSIVSTEFDYLYINGSNKKLYKIDSQKYEKAISNNPFLVDETLENFYYIDDSGSMFLVFENYDNVPKWIKHILEKENGIEKEYVITFVTTRN